MRQSIDTSRTKTKRVSLLFLTQRLTSGSSRGTRLMARRTKGSCRRREHFDINTAFQYRFQDAERAIQSQAQTAATFDMASAPSCSFAMPLSAIAAYLPQDRIYKNSELKPKPVSKFVSSINNLFASLPPCPVNCKLNLHTARGSAMELLLLWN
jgi:hypothetical protein